MREMTHAIVGFVNEVYPETAEKLIGDVATPRLARAPRHASSHEDLIARAYEVKFSRDRSISGAEVIRPRRLPLIRVAISRRQ